MIEKRPSIFDYLSYRHFLRDIVQFLRSKGGYSIRTFAKKVGFGSSSYMKAIMDGKRTLTARSQKTIARALNLDRAETEFFTALVQFNQSKVKDQQERAFRQLLSIKGLRRSRRLQIQELRFYSDWRQVALYTGLGTEWGQSNHNSLAKLLGISDFELKQITETLIDLKLISKSGSRFIQNDLSVQTPSETHSLNIRAFHRAMIEKAKESIDGFATAQRSLSSLTLGLSQSEFSYVKKRIDQLRRELTARFADSSKATGVYQVNFQAFPLISFDKNRR